MVSRRLNTRLMSSARVGKGIQGVISNQTVSVNNFQASWDTGVQKNLDQDRLTLQVVHPVRTFGLLARLRRIGGSKRFLTCC